MPLRSISLMIAVGTIGFLFLSNMQVISISDVGDGIFKRTSISKIILHKYSICGSSLRFNRFYVHVVHLSRAIVSQLFSNQVSLKQGRNEFQYLLTRIGCCKSLYLHFYRKSHCTKYMALKSESISYGEEAFEKPI